MCDALVASVTLWGHRLIALARQTTPITLSVKEFIRPTPF